MAASITELQDKRYEEEITRNPFNLRTWLSFIDIKKEAKASSRYVLYERAIKHLPRSYKLWHLYLNEKAHKLRHKCVTDKKYDELVKLYERALIHLHKMPVIWQEYCGLLVKLRKGTDTRIAFDNALQALPITQHYNIWEQYIEWATEFGVPETAIRIFQRYLMFNPSYRENFVEYLEANLQFREAAKQLMLCMDDNYISSKNRTRHEMWMHLCDICAQYPEQVSDEINVENIIRSGIARFSDEVGRLWCRLADYYIRYGMFEKARDVYEEAMNAVITVRDFTLVYEAYTKFEESILSTKIRITTEVEELIGETTATALNDLIETQPSCTVAACNALLPAAISKKLSSEDFEAFIHDKKDIMLRLVRLEYLMDMRPILLNAVVLRQNPHNVYEWHKRIKLYKQEYGKKKNKDEVTVDAKDVDVGTKEAQVALRAANLERIISTYLEAINTVNPALCKGKFSTIWLSLASYYEFHYSDNRELNLENARTIYRKATQVLFKHVDELASIWCSWAEMELKYECYDKALLVMQEAITEPQASIQRRKLKTAIAGSRRNNKFSYNYNTEEDMASAIPVTDRVHKHTKLWEFYLDLEESLGTLETTRMAYDRALELNIITPQMALNYAKILEEHNYFEDSFKIYERSIAIFGYPHVKHIWMTYLDKFIDRYEGKKLERLRDLCEQVLITCPTEYRVEFYIKYSKIEEKYGLARHALAIYDRATKDSTITADIIKVDLFHLYIRKAEQFYGVTKTRPIYERAIKELGDAASCQMCLEYANMECTLGEIDRSRALYQHGSQLVDPKQDTLQYWNKWKQFEENYGNENTFRDMLRMQRSAEVAFSQVHYMAAEMAASTNKGTSSAALKGNDAISRLAMEAESQPAGVSQMQGFVPASNLNALSVVSNPHVLNQGNVSNSSTTTAASSGGSGSLKRNHEEIDIDAEEDEDGDGEDEIEETVRVVQKQIPSAVFGSLIQTSDTHVESQVSNVQPAKKVAKLH